MKKGLLAALFLLGTTVAATAQQQSRIGCVDKAMRLQAEELKQGFTKHGMTVYRDAMVSMTSKEVYPIAVDLRQGELYQMIYIGSREASKIEFELYDAQKQKLDTKKLNDPAETNFLIYSFSPSQSGVYYVGLTQKLKNRDLCGSFTILQQAKTDTPAK